MIERIVSYRSIFIADHEFVLGSCCKVGILLLYCTVTVTVYI